MENEDMGPFSAELLVGRDPETILESGSHTKFLNSRYWHKPGIYASAVSACSFQDKGRGCHRISRSDVQSGE